MCSTNIRSVVIKRQIHLIIPTCLKSEHNVNARERQCNSGKAKPIHNTCNVYIEDTLVPHVPADITSRNFAPNKPSPKSMLWLLLLRGPIAPRTGISSGRAGSLTGITILNAVIALAGGSSRRGHGTDTLKNALDVLYRGLSLPAVGFKLVLLLLEGSDLFFASIDILLLVKLSEDSYPCLVRLNNPLVFVHKFFISCHVSLHHCIKSRPELIKVKLLHLIIKYRAL